MKDDRRRERQQFLDHLVAVNLRRIWLITLVSLVLTFGLFMANVLVFKRGEVMGIEAFDLLASLGMLALIAAVRRAGVRESWRRAFVLFFLLMWLVVMDAYFFTVFSALGHNTSYVIGAMAIGVSLLLPPALFLPLLAVNHAVYCALLLASGRNFANVLSTPLLDGTVGAAIAGLASWILYHAARENFRKERVIVQRNRALAASNMELREVMAIAAHDLQSPLFGVRDLLAVGSREPAVAEGSRLRRILDQARATCDGLAQLVSRLVAAHAAEEKRNGLALVPQDPRPACAAAVEHLQATADAKEQRILITLPDELVTAAIDRDTLVQALENLLGNALKFSPRGAVVDVSLSVNDGACRIEVSDRGPGVPEEERAKLFQKFHRGGAQPTGGETSTGLGLFIVQKLVEAMNGKVSHEPRDGGGSVFSVSLPASRT